MAPHAAPPHPPGTPAPHRSRPRDSVRPRLTHRLVFKFYLWLLLALTLSILAAGSFFFLVSWRGVETRLMERAFSIVTSARDVTGNLLASGLPATEVERILAPLIRQGRTALAVVNEDGIPVLLLTAPGALPPGWPPSAARVRTVLQTGGGIEPGEGPRMGANLPIDLPGGGRGAMFVVVRRTDWRADHPHFRLWAGLAVILGVVWLLSWPLASHLTRPLRRLADTAERLGSGDLTIRSDLRRRDEIGRLADRFNRMADNLQRLVLGHKQLLSDVSHELRTPLARLRVALELARKEAGPAALPYLERVEGQAEAMEDLTGELLTLARQDAAPDTFQPEPIDPRALLGEVAQAHRSEAEGRRIVFSLHGGDAPASFPADRARLTRALGNLVRNAIAHGPEGSTVHLTAGVEDERLCFRVRDEGPGVAPEQRESIFQPFFRTDTARNRATGGVGLGLAIARRCMESQRGGAFAEAGPEGVGLTVVLWLPFPGAPARDGKGA